MGTVTSHHGTTLTRAAARERERLLAHRERVAQRLSQLDKETNALRTSLTDLDEQIELLDRLLSSDPRATPTSGARVLRGAELRERALTILATSLGSGEAIQYRDWYRLVTDAGFIVLGKRPIATFLTGVTRSPIVAAAAEPGTYYLDFSAVGGIRKELGELQAELSDLDRHLADRPSGKTPLRRHRANLLASIRRVERQLDEADRIFEARRAHTFGSTQAA